MTQLILDLPDTLYQRATQLAELTGQSIESVVMQLLGESLPPLHSEIDVKPIETLDNDEILMLANSMMPARQNAQFSILQDKQQAGTITDLERAELHLLMQVFEAGQLRKVQAMVEAKKRNISIGCDPL